MPNIVIFYTIFRHITEYRFRFTPFFGVDLEAMAVFIELQLSFSQGRHVLGGVESAPRARKKSLINN